MGADIEEGPRGAVLVAAASKEQASTPARFPIGGGACWARQATHGPKGAGPAGAQAGRLRDEGQAGPWHLELELGQRMRRGHGPARWASEGARLSR